jgi:hypothetical protein
MLFPDGDEAFVASPEKGVTLVAIAENCETEPKLDGNESQMKLIHQFVIDRKYYRWGIMSWKSNRK